MGPEHESASSASSADSASIQAWKATSGSKTRTWSIGSAASTAVPSLIDAVSRASTPSKEEGLHGALLARDTGISQNDIVGYASSGERVYWESFFVVFPFFCGYATLFGFQHAVKWRLGIGDDGSDDSYAFGVAISMLYLFALLARLTNALIDPRHLAKRTRVLLSMGTMMLAQLVLLLIMTKGTPHLSLVGLAYSLGGMALGFFESSFLSYLAPLGHQTKRIAITAVPIGIATILVGGFLMMSSPLGVYPSRFYALNICGLLAGIVILCKRVPDKSSAGSSPLASPRMMLDLAVANAAGSSSPSIEVNKRGLRLLVWLPQFWHYPIATVINMLCLAAFCPGVVLFMYDGDSVDLAAGYIVKTDSFLAIFNTFSMLGGIVGRWLSYRVRYRHPLVYNSMNFIGVALILLKWPLVAPIGVLFVQLGDGLIYGSISRHIDTRLQKEFNLAAISYWLVLGDIGSFAGTNLIAYIKELMN
jgi:hypothetical protein